MAEHLPPYGGGTNLFRCLDWAPDGRALIGALGEPATGDRVPGVVLHRLDHASYELIAERGSPIGVADDGLILVADGDESYWIDPSGDVVERVVGENQASIGQASSGLPSRAFLISRDGSTMYRRTIETEGDIWMVDLSGGGE